ncbi:MAG: hypothetical protein KGK08_13730 [Acidobacteriota bacterium]|nr:hypothetical protein [Acidobacteriota bacterium]
MAVLPSFLPSLRSLPLAPSRPINPGNLLERTRPFLVVGSRTQPSTAPRATFRALPCEHEDALLTGTTRSLDRRRMALNLAGSLPGAAPRAAQPQPSRRGMRATLVPRLSAAHA